MKQINRHALIKGLKLSLSISIIISVILFLRTMNFEQLKEMQRIKPGYLVLAVGLMFLMWLVQGLRMQVLARALDEKITLKDGIKNYLSGAFVSNVTPFASGGGPVQTFFLHQLGMSFGKASSIIIVQWVMRHLFFGILGPIFIFFYRNLVDPGKMPKSAFDASVIGSISITIALLFLVWKPQIIPLLAKGIVKLPFFKWIDKQGVLRRKFERLIDYSFGEIAVFHDCLWTLAAKKKIAIFLAMIFTCLFWIFFFMIAPVLLIGLGAQPFFIRGFIMQTIMFLILPYIPTPGATGAAELGFVTFFSPFVPSHLLGILLLAWRFLTFYSFIIIGSIITLKLVSD